MIRNLKTIFILSLALLISGCMSAQPQKLGQYYFMGGDSECVRYRTTSNPQIVKCFDSKGNYTGNRSAMTSQDIQMYQYKQARNDEAVRDFGRWGESMRSTQCITSVGITTCF